MRRLRFGQSALLVLSAILAIVVMACGGSGAVTPESQSLAKVATSTEPAATTPPTATIDPQFYCKDVSGTVDLERYLLGAARDGGLPSPTSPDYLKALPPVCIVSPIGGVPPYDASASVDGVPLKRVATGTTELTFTLPPLPPGTHTVKFNATDSRGSSGSGEAKLDWEWANPGHMAVTAQSPADLSLYTPGTQIDFSASYEADGLVQAPQLAIEDYVPQQYAVKWDFGDGTTQQTETPKVSGTIAASHSYASQGIYSVRVSVTGDTYGQTASTSFRVDVRPEGTYRLDSGEVVYKWELVETRVNPGNAPLSVTKIDKVFLDDSLNNYISTVASVGPTQFQIAKTMGKGPKESFVGNYNFSFSGVPDEIIAGRTGKITIKGLVTPSLGQDSTGFTATLSGLTDLADTQLKLSSDSTDAVISPEFTAPQPTSLDDSFTISIRVAGCDACSVDWVFRVKRP